MKNSKENWTKQTKKNTHRLFYWTITWTLSVALAQFGAIYLWDYHPIISTIAIIFNFLLGIGLILINKKYLGTYMNCLTVYFFSNSYKVSYVGFAIF